MDRIASLPGASHASVCSERAVGNSFAKRSGGRIAAGETQTASGSRATLWTSSAGVQDLNTLLPAMGIDLTGWTLLAARAVSIDGRAIGGDGLHNGIEVGWVARVGAWPCYPNCDGSTATPNLNVADFLCYMGRIVAADPYANCDGSTAPPALNIEDFLCFQRRYAAGCP